MLVGDAVQSGVLGTCFLQFFYLKMEAALHLNVSD